MGATARDGRPYLGRGWKFPLQVDARGALAGSALEQHVEESILVILATSPGERVMRPDFGCGIHDLVFAPNDPTTVSLAVDQVRRALVAYEPRIDVLDVSAQSPTEQPNLLLIRVEFRIRDNNAVGNVVFPFYITEAS
jgi:phage baseplate assembly protein W